MGVYIYIYIYICVFVAEVLTQVTKCFFEVRGLIRQPAIARLTETDKLLYTSARLPPPQRPFSQGGPLGPHFSKIQVAVAPKIKLLTELASREESAVPANVNPPPKHSQPDDTPTRQQVNARKKAPKHVPGSRSEIPRYKLAIIIVCKCTTRTA